jgi:hypothetical protein
MHYRAATVFPEFRFEHILLRLALWAVLAYN